MKRNTNAIIRDFAKLKWWQIALISLVASVLGGLSSGVPSKKERKLYNEELQQAPWGHRDGYLDLHGR